ncbi:GNAT family N-acetyltransferase [Ruminococcus flavefaciens]|uniref:Acetyltransferase (GNAT) domain-containing protein n=1 Tax=Ruminococcus flavefaciens TaxID=1265 RepID=A0A1M7L4U2_RUMFL|nr:GNAT family N-acetyltransferase [Ruminococcus flavefaciens]SHM73070.1 Acetyltransferase (GNAT) domain-containing protein [Ruminococcus flavefaciens]
MFSLRPANTADIEKEYIFVRDIPADENGFINDYPDISREDFDDALDTLIANSYGERLPEGYVPATTYFLWHDDDIVGEFQLRHHLCPSLIDGSGHIGYYIAPKYRGKGYATEGLRLLIEEARKTITEDEIYLRVRKSNPASLKVMQKNGGWVRHEDAESYFVRIKKEQK